MKAGFESLHTQFSPACGVLHTPHNNQRILHPENTYLAPISAIAIYGAPLGVGLRRNGVNISKGATLAVGSRTLGDSQFGLEHLETLSSGVPMAAAHAGSSSQAARSHIHVAQTRSRTQYAARAASPPGASRAELESLLARREAELAGMFDPGRAMPKV